MSALAQRYASALADVVVQQGSAQAASQALSAFLQAYESSEDLHNLLSHPSVEKAVKQRVIEKIGERLALTPAVRNFLYVVVDNRRMHLLPEMQQAFETELNARLGAALVEVTSAQELGPAEKTEMLRALEQLTGKRIQASYRLDPALIGGAQVRIGSTIYDGSVREQLNRFRAQVEARP